MSAVMQPVPQGDPLMTGWEQFKQTSEYTNAKNWAANPQHLEGSLLAMYERGFRDATERAANLHEQVDSASDAERLGNIPGAGAMGAVIEYRDRIRQTVAASSLAK